MTPAARRGRWGAIIVAALWSALPVAATSRSGLVAERVVIVMRHGVRAPLIGEVPDSTRTSAPWPRWPTPPGSLTPHGAAALERQGAAERRWLVAQGLLPGRGCPSAGTVVVRTNTADRTIASGAAFVGGLLPGCPTAIDHGPSDVADPLFEPLRSDAGPAFDAAAAIGSIDRYTGGLDRLAARHRTALRLLDRVLGCMPPMPCDPGKAGVVTMAAGGRGIDLTGPIRTASGTAQALLLEYLDGMPADRVGWGRADLATLRRLGALHAALFDVFTRPPYMAARQAGPLGRRVIGALTAPRSAVVTVLVGHDTNVTALAAALRVPLIATGFAPGDVPPGGSLVFEELRRRADGRRYVRVSYRYQTPQMIRGSGKGVVRAVLRVPGCGGLLCPSDRFVRLFGRHLAPDTHR